MDYKEFEHFGDIEKYKKNLLKLSRIDFSKLSQEEIYNKYFDLALILPTMYSMINSAEFNKLEFHRVRLNIDFKKENKNLEQTYSYPPSTFCKENGRANLKGTSVFYCSNDPKTAMEEVRPEIGDTGVLSVWKGKTNRKVKLTTCLNEILPQQNLYKLLAKQNYTYLNNSANIPENSRKHLEELIHYIAKKFVIEQKPYPLTSMISKELLFATDIWNDAIIYPSFTQKKQSCNLAFHPNSVNQLLELSKIMPFRITDKKNDQFIFNFNKKIGERRNNTFIWREINKNDKTWFNEN